jgi:IS605 OrfB family transposase
METIRTICCKLNPTPEQVVEIDATLQAFAAACNRVADVCRSLNTTNKVKVQKECYAAVRTKFGLSANLTIRAIARVCAALKVPQRRASTFALTSIDYDQRIFSFREQDWTFSLTLLPSRQRLKALLGEFQRKALTGQRPTSATLVKRGNTFHLHVQVKERAPASTVPSDVLGVDLGVVNLAVDSTGEVFSGEGVDEIRQRYSRRRRSLNRCGTKSARRRLRKIRRKESQYRADVNHRISKRIVAKAKDTSSAVAVEELTGIGTRTTAPRSQRTRLKGWAFFQLRSFIAYKAQRAGVIVVAVDPRNTSRTCSRCGHCEKANRKSRDLFCCRSCGHEAPADLNAARNIRTIGLMSCSLTASRDANAGVVDAGSGNSVEAACKPLGGSPSGS